MNAISCADIAALRAIPAGTLVALEGGIVALRDRTLMRLADLKERNEPSPIDLTGRIVLFAGPTPGFEEGRGSIGPTTSRRLAAYLPLLSDFGVVAIIGKGPLDESALRALREGNICYLQALGGAGAFYGKRVTSMKTIGYDDLGPEALYELTVRDFVVIMSFDTAGNRYP